jgi:hypothetical protein
MVFLYLYISRGFSCESCTQTRTSIYPHIANNICLHWYAERRLPLNAASKLTSLLILIAARSKEGVCVISLNGTGGSNPVGDMDVCLLCVCVCVCVVCCQIAVSSWGRSLVQRGPTDTGVCKLWSLKLVKQEAYALQDCRSTNKNNNQQSFPKNIFNPKFILVQKYLQQSWRFSLSIYIEKVSPKNGIRLKVRLKSASSAINRNTYKLIITLLILVIGFLLCSLFAYWMNDSHPFRDKNGGYCNESRGGPVVEALRYKPEGRGISSRWCYWNCSLT